MLIALPDVLTREQVAACRAIVDRAEWIDGSATAGHQAALAKNNLQLHENSPASRDAGNLILEALGRTPRFIAAALPLKVFPPLFNRYGGGHAFGMHVDGSVRQLRGTDFRVRSDLSCTLFLTDPGDYEGGELVVADTFGTHRVKLPAGHLVLYPSSSLHEVTPVTRGMRTSSFFWVQSMVRDDGNRTLLLQLDNSIQALAAQLSHKHAEVVALTGVYHNLLRRWAEM